MANTANPPVLYEPQSANLAPLKPLLEIQKGNPKAESSLGKALKDRYNYHIALQARELETLYLNGYEVANFIEGRQFLRPNPWVPGTYLAYTPKTANEANKRSINLMRFYTTNALWKWQLSNPDIVATAGIDTEQAREAAKAADLIVEHYERKFFRPVITIKEAMHGLCWGTYIWRIRYDDSKPSITALQPIYGEQEVALGDGYGQCGDCGLSGTADQFPDNGDGTAACPECGGSAMVESATESVPTVIGQQEVQLGDITAELLPFPECRWDLNYRAEDSSWFIHQRRTSATAIRRLLGNVMIPKTDDKADLGLDIIDKLAWAGQSGGGQARVEFSKVKLYEEPVTVVEYSLGPDDIADINLKADEETLSGQVIPAGPLLNTFPDGLTVQGINGLSIITGLYNEHHSKSIVQGVWHSRTMSGVGQGFNDLTEVQKRFNADDSQVHTFLRAIGTPGMLFRQEALGDQDRSDYIGDPRINIAINSQNLPENTRLEDIVRPAWQPQSVPGQLFQYTYDRLNDFAQLTSHITDFSGGLPNVNNRTATGAQISQANSNALFTPPLQVKGEVRQRIAEIVVELYKQHFPVTRPFPLKGRYGRFQYVYLNGADLCNDIRFEVVKDSELPRNMFTKREDYTAFFMMLGGAAGYSALQQQNPELVLEMERNFNIQLNSDTYDQISTLCQQRIQQMKDAAQFVGEIGMGGLLAPQAAEPRMQQPLQQQSAPEQQAPALEQGPQPMIPTGPQLLLVAIDPPPVLEEPDHQLKAKYLSEWLDMDDGQLAAPELRQAVIALIQLHFQFFVEQTAALSMVAGMTQPQDPNSDGSESGGAGGGPQKKDDGKPNTTPTDPNKRGPITGRPKPRSAQ